MGPILGAVPYFNPKTNTYSGDEVGGQRTRRYVSKASGDTWRPPHIPSDVWNKWHVGKRISAKEIKETRDQWAQEWKQALINKQHELLEADQLNKLESRK